MIICQQIFAILALVIFLFKFLLKVFQNRLFVASAPTSSFQAANSGTIVRKGCVCVKAFLCESFCEKNPLCVNASLCRGFSV